MDSLNNFILDLPEKNSINSLLTTSIDIETKDKSVIKSEYEFECRFFGKYSDLFILQLKNKLKKDVEKNPKYSISVSSDTVYSISKDKNLMLRKIISDSEDEKNITYQLKKKVEPVDLKIITEFNPEVTTVIRFSKSLEETLAENDSIKNLNWEKALVRKRLRYSYNFNYYTIDITQIENSGTEIEVEFSNQEIKNITKDKAEDYPKFRQLFLKAFNKIYPDIHTVITEDAFKAREKDIKLKYLIKETYSDAIDIRPVNIQLKKHVNKNLENYAVTNKLDGVQYNLLITLDSNNVYTKIILFNSKDFWLIAYNNKPVTKQIILRVELVLKKDVLELWAFDYIFENNFDVIKLNLGEKIKLIQSIKNNDSVNKFFNETLKNKIRFEIKTFFYSENNDLVENIKKATKWMAENYGLFDCINTNDGLIFEPINGVNEETKTLKWKFPSRVGIDFKFEFKEINNGIAEYYLHTREVKAELIRIEDKKTNAPLILDLKDKNLDNKKAKISVFFDKETKQLKANFKGIVTNDEINVFNLSEYLDKEKKDKIVLLKRFEDKGYEIFVSSDTEKSSRFKIDNSDSIIKIPAESSIDGFSVKELNNFIVEVGWKSGSFYIMRVRTDKLYANGPKVAKETFQDMINMLTLPEVIRYYTEKPYTDEKCLKNYRKLHNDIKGFLIQEFSKDKVVLDLGIGKGGDLGKYSKAVVKTLFGVEPNIEFISELKERLSSYPYFKMNKNFFLLENKTGQDVDDIIKFTKKQNIDIIFMMFSLTYFYKEKIDLYNLAQTITNELKSPESLFVGTFMNGYYVRNELVKNKPFSNKKSISNYNDFIIKEEDFKSKEEEDKLIGILVNFGRVFEKIKYEDPKLFENLSITYKHLYNDNKETKKYEYLGLNGSSLEGFISDANLLENKKIGLITRSKFNSYYDFLIDLVNQTSLDDNWLTQLDFIIDEWDKTTFDSVIEDTENCWSIQKTILHQNRWYGDEVKVDLKSTETAEKLTEWLVYIDLLSDFLYLEGIFLINYKDFSQFSTNLLNDGEIKLNNLYSYFIYQKCQLIPAEIIGYSNLFLPASKIRQFLDVLFEAWLGPSYDIKFGLEIKKILIANFTFERFLQLNVVKIAFELIKKNKNICKLLDSVNVFEFELELENKMKTNSFIEILEQNFESEKYQILLIVLKNIYDEQLNFFTNNQKVPSDIILEFLESELNLNIMIFDEEKEKWLSEPKKFNILLYKFIQGSFEVIKIKYQDTSLIELDEIKKNRHERYYC